MDIHEQAEPGHGEENAKAFALRQAFIQKEMGQDGHEYGHGVIEYGHEPRRKSDDANLHSRIIQDNLGNSREKYPGPVFSLWPERVAERADQKQHGSCHQGPAGNEQDGREIGRRYFHDDPVVAPDHI